MLKLYEYLTSSGYDRRKSQEEMIDIVLHAIEKSYEYTSKEPAYDDFSLFEDEEEYDKTHKNYKEILKAERRDNTYLIEAPTGTGKSFGYLLPIIERRQKAIVSTKTKILQEQLRGDLENLSEVSKKVLGRGIKYLVLKGKSNYLCLDRFYDLEEKLSGEDKQTRSRKQKKMLVNTAEQGKHLFKLAAIKDFMEKDRGWDGDVEFLPIPVSDIWDEINIDEHYCDATYRKSCPYRDRCYFYAGVKAKEREADILVINHSLLALRRFDSINFVNHILVIDEAHELDEALVRAFTETLSTTGLRKLISMIENTYDETVDVDVESVFKEVFDKKLDDYIENQQMPVAYGGKRKKKYDDIDRNVTMPVDGDAFFVDELREKIYTPLKSTVDKIENTIKNNLKGALEGSVLSLKLKDILISVFKKEYVDSLKCKFKDLKDREPSKIEKETVKAVARFKRIKSAVNNINSILNIAQNKDKNSYGVVVSRENNKYAIEVMPIFAKDAIKCENFKAVILTSATLSDKLIALTTGITGRYYSLKPVFDYTKVMFLVKSVNPKNREVWLQALQHSLRELKEKHGVVLALLTAYEQMKAINEIADDDYIFQTQDVKLSDAIEKVRKREKKVLVGVDSVWTGIDIKGEKGILLAKLPFDLPSEPIHYFRMKHFEKHQINGFQEYTLQRCFLKFKQGFGRLMRDKNDSGTVVLCDNRIWGYKDLFLAFVKALGVRVVA